MAEELLENPVIKDDSDIETALRDLAGKVDAQGIELGSESSIESQLAPSAASGQEEPKPEVKPDNSEASAEPARDAQGRFTKADGTKSEPNEAVPKAGEVVNTPTEQQKQESAFAKAKKEAERKNRTWEQINAEKESWRAEQAREKAAIEAERQTLQQQRQGKGPSQFTSQQYDQAADDFERQAKFDAQNGNSESAAGNYDLATKARKAGERAREFEQKQQFEQQKGGFEQTWKQGMEATIKEHPELANPASEISKAVLEMFKVDPVFNYIPDGFAKARQIAEWKLGSEQASGLRDENNQLKTELQKFQKLTAVGGSSPTKHGGSGKKFDDMSITEMEDDLKRKAEYAGGIAA